MGISKVAIAAAGAALLISGTAQAATPVPQANGHALLLIPLTLTKISDLDFGTVVTSSASGVVTIDAYTGARTFSGGVTGVASDAGNRASFAGAGSAGQQVIIVVDPPVNLVSAAGDAIPVLGLTLDGPITRTIDSTRAFYVNLGGSLGLAANQAEGDYQADFTVTANYQ